MKMEEGETQKNRSCLLFQLFQMISISLLSLLVPLSFLFLSRLSLFNYHLLTISAPTVATVATVNHLLHHINVAVLYTVMSSMTVGTLIYSLSGKPEYSLLLRSRLYICWIVLFSVQACIDLGLRGTMSVNFDTRSFLESQERWVSIKVLFFLGLHEVMLMWFRVVVKPVVDDTVLKVYTEERWSERTIVAVTFGIMWWWRLRNEVEGMVAAAELKQKLGMGLEVMDFVNWWMYYVCVVIGFVKVLRGFLWAKEVLVSEIITIKSCECIDDYAIV